MKKLSIAFLLGAIIITAGCEKEKVFFETQLEGAESGVGLGQPNGEPIELTVEASATTIEQAINVFLSSNNKGTATVSIAVDEALVDEYNAANGTAFAVMPSDIYNIPGSINISNGSGSANATFDIQKLLEYGTLFAIGYKITDVSGATDYIMPGNSANVVIIKVKNPYEGEYSCKGYFYHPSAPRAIARDKFVATIDPNTSEAELGDLGGSAYFFHFDVEGSNVTNWQPVGATPTLPSSGFMTLDNPAGIGTYPGPGGFTHDAYPNTYDAASGVFKLHYGYGVGSANQAGYTRQVYEQWTLK